MVYRCFSFGRYSLSAAVLLAKQAAEIEWSLAAPSGPPEPIKQRTGTRVLRRSVAGRGQAGGGLRPRFSRRCFERPRREKVTRAEPRSWVVPPYTDTGRKRHSLVKAGWIGTETSASVRQSLRKRRQAAWAALCAFPITNRAAAPYPVDCG